MKKPEQKERDMEHLVPLGEFFHGLGWLFVGIGVLWFVSMYKPKD